MALPPDDDVIVDNDAHQAAGFGDLGGDLDVGAAGLGGAGGVVVDEDHGGGADFQRFLYDFAGVDRAFVERALADQMIEDQHVLGVQIEHADAFDVEVRHIDVQVIEQRLPV